MNEGWVKIHRSILDSQFWLSDKFNDSHAWIDLILLANHKDSIITKRGIRLEVKRGYVGWSERVLADRWKWSRGKVRRFFDFLIQQNMIQIEQQKNKVSALIKIVKYDIYQGSGTTDSTTDVSTDGQQTDNKRYQNKNDKKEKKEYSDDFLIFYDAYPNKKDKDAAWKAWRKRNGSRPEISILLSAIEAQVEWRNKANGSFRPHWKNPATWINSGSWMDVLDNNDGGSNDEDLDKWAMK